MGRSALVAAALAALCALPATACSSGSSVRPADSPAAPSTTGSAPSTSGAPSSSTAPTTTAPTTSAPPPTSSATSKPLSAFENDPAVKALRAWGAEMARSVNAGRLSTPRLRTMMTSTLTGQMHYVDGGDIGRYYPGPLPFTPLGVHVLSSTHRQVRMCVLAQGYTEHPRTHKAWGKRRVLPTIGDVVEVDGRWLVAGVPAGNFSCAGVAIRTPSW